MEAYILESKTQLLGIPVGQLEIDETYQRPVSLAHVRKMVKNFNPSSVGVLTVSARSIPHIERPLYGGRPYRYFVVDGQHRVEALKAVSPHSAVRCEVHFDLAVTQEAAMFNGMQTDRKSLRPLDRWKARIVAGEASAEAINQVLETYGWRIGTSGSPGSISAIAAIEKSCRRRDNSVDRDVLAAMLRLANEAELNKRHDGLPSDIIGMLSVFIRKYRNLPVFDVHRAASKLRSLHFDDIRREARGIRDTDMAHYLARIYNKRLDARNRLPIPGEE